jgi:hypothetical protein
LKLCNLKREDPSLAMSCDPTSAKRPRSDSPSEEVAAEEVAAKSVCPEGKEQLLVAIPQLQELLGRKYICDETELLPLLIQHGCMRRVRTIELTVQQPIGDSIKVTLDASTPRVAEAKAELERRQGIVLDRYSMHLIRKDCEPKVLIDEDVCHDGDMLDLREVEEVKAIKEEDDETRLRWRTRDSECVTFSEGGVLATKVHDAAAGGSLVTSGIELAEGRHFWEVELESSYIGGIAIGVSKPNLDPNGRYLDPECADTWFIHAHFGSTWGNGKWNNDPVGGFVQYDRVGMLLDLDVGSLRFFKNGEEHGPGYAVGSVRGPVVHAVQMYIKAGAVRLNPDAAWPIGHTPIVWIQTETQIQEKAAAADADVPTFFSSGESPALHASASHIDAQHGFMDTSHTSHLEDTSHMSHLEDTSHTSHLEDTSHTSHPEQHQLEHLSSPQQHGQLLQQQLRQLIPPPPQHQPGQLQQHLLQYGQPPAHSQLDQQQQLFQLQQQYREFRRRQQQPSQPQQHGQHGQQQQQQ